MRRTFVMLVIVFFHLAGDSNRAARGADPSPTANGQKTANDVTGRKEASSGKLLVHDLDKEIEDATKAIGLNPKSTDAYNRRADAYFRKRNFDQAIADYSEAIRLDPKSIGPYIDRSFMNGLKGDWDKAMADATKAVRLDPKAAIAWNHVGIAYDGYARALSAADAKAAATLFDHASAHFDGPPGKIDAAQQQLPFDGSVEHFKAAARKLDRAHQVQLLFDYSAAAFKAAIDLKPGYDFGNNNLGVYYARRGGPGDMKLAEKYFRAAVESNPRYADAFNNLGIVLTRQGKLDDAIASHKAGLRVRNDRASDHNNLCRVYLQKGDLESAVRENTLARQCDPNSLGAWLTGAEIGIEQKDLDEAARCIQRMTEIDDKSPETIHAELLVADGYLNLKGAKAAIDLLDEFLIQNPAAPEIYLARGKAYEKTGKLIRAKEDFEQALRIRPNYADAQQQLNFIRSQLDNSKKQTP
jgi:tetratricopeptide (TPR) repeat protein